MASAAGGGRCHRLAVWRRQGSRGVLPGGRVGAQEQRVGAHAVAYAALLAVRDGVQGSTNSEAGGARTLRQKANVVLSLTTVTQRSMLPPNCRHICRPPTLPSALLSTFSGRNE